MENVLPLDDPKHSAIVTAAFGVFAQYGYRRTSMEDIAQAAGMSRPALYQYFRNKEDVARSLVAGFFARVAEDVEAALAVPGSPPETLERAFRAKMGPMKTLLVDSPHGSELMELGNMIAAEQVAEGMARLLASFAGWLERGRIEGHLSFEGGAQEVAQTILAALDGVKTPPFEVYEARMVQLANLLGRGLAA